MIKQKRNSDKVHAGKPATPRETGGVTGDKLRGHVEPLILSSLEQGEAHGLDILKRIEQAGSGALKLKEGSLYPALYRLEQAGLLKARWESGETKRRGARRRFYQLTNKGSKQLAKARNEWLEFVSIMNLAMGVNA